MVVFVATVILTVMTSVTRVIVTQLSKDNAIEQPLFVTGYLIVSMAVMRKIVTVQSVNLNVVETFKNVFQVIGYVTVIMIVQIEVTNMIQDAQSVDVLAMQRNVKMVHVYQSIYFVMERVTVKTVQMKWHVR
jgi:hypothetical protein